MQQSRSVLATKQNQSNGSGSNGKSDRESKNTARERKDNTKDKASDIQNRAVLKKPRKPRGKKDNDNAQAFAGFEDSAITWSDIEAIVDAQKDQNERSRPCTMVFWASLCFTISMQFVSRLVRCMDNVADNEPKMQVSAVSVLVLYGPVTCV
jgi:hypothetical protein